MSDKKILIILLLLIIINIIFFILLGKVENTQKGYFNKEIIKEREKKKE